MSLSTNNEIKPRTKAKARLPFAAHAHRPMSYVFSDIKKILNLEITLSHMQPATYNYGLIPKG